jgi:asparaginyl-tRNA synthetase
MKTISINSILTLKPIGNEMQVEGWVRTKRESKNLAFLEVNDGTTLQSLQVVVSSDMPDYEKTINRLSNGCSVSINGKIIESMGQGQKIEMAASNVTLIGPASPEEYPLQKKKHSFEFLREIAHLRPRTNTFGAIARLRSSMSFAIHSFFHERDFVYIHSPIITGSDCEGAGSMFQVTTLPLEEIVKADKKIDYTADFFGKRASLTVSGQLEGETYACALKNIYTFGPTFRAEHSNTSRHLAEFWMIEPEMAFCDIRGNMDIAEEFLKYIFTWALERCPADMAFFDDRIQKGLISNIETVAASPFERISYSDAIKLLEKSNEKFEFQVKWGIDIQSEHERYIAEKIFGRPVIITGYPKEIKAFYMKQNDDGKTVRAMDILVPRLGEIIGGSERESDYDKLSNRIMECGLNPDDYKWYLDLRRFGTVPHSGFGLGFERLIQYMTGMQNIRDVIPYPRAYNYLEF